MNFQELVNEVILITKRPDLKTRIESAVRAATLKAHHSDYYYKDLHELPVAFTEPFILQSFLPTDVAPNFRKIKYLRLWNGDIQGDVGQFLTPIQIENSLDSYNYIKTNVYYMAGQLIQMRGTCALDKVLFGCYLHPVVTPETAFDSWIAVEMPYVIIYEASRVIFKSISFTEQANEYGQLTAEQYSELKLSYVDDVPLT